MGVHSAVLYFNEGTVGLNGVKNYLNLDIGARTAFLFPRKDRVRLCNMGRKGDLKAKTRRKKVKSHKKRFSGYRERS